SPSKTKRKLEEYQQELSEIEKDHFCTFDIDHDRVSFSKSLRLSSQSPLYTCHQQSQSSPIDSNMNLEQNQQNLAKSPPPPLETTLPPNFQTKIVQEFNIQQTNSSDITVSSTINIKSYSNDTTTKESQSSATITANDLLSEADFDRVIKDITPADRNLFDEFLIVGSTTTTATLYSTKKSDEEDLFISNDKDLYQLVENDFTNNDQTTTYFPSHDLLSCNGIPYVHHNMSDKRRNSISSTIQQQHITKSTIHYPPQNMCNTYSSSSFLCNDSKTNNRHLTQPPLSGPAATTLKKMAVQHQQRLHHGVYLPTAPYHPMTQGQTYQQQQQCITTVDNSFDSSVCNSQLRQGTNFDQLPQTSQPRSYNKKYVNVSTDGTMQSYGNPCIPQQPINLRSSNSFSSSYMMDPNAFYHQQQQQHQQMIGSSLYSNYAPQMPYNNNTTEMSVRQQIPPSTTSTNTNQSYRPCPTV
ncbi:unnamed protein product, partial [Didymodactylos carnosus]